MDLLKMAVVQIPIPNSTLNPNPGAFSPLHRRSLPQGRTLLNCSKHRTFRCLCCDGSPENCGGMPASFSGCGSLLHDLMDQAGIDTNHAKIARRSFSKALHKLQNRGIDTLALESSHIGYSLDLARAALEISAEDDALVSHSPVPLPVDSYLERLTGMAMEFAGHHIPAQDQTPEAILCCLDNYLYGYKNFHKITGSHTGGARDCYLNMVLARRIGSPLMLALIYSELVNILHSWKVIDFTVNMELPEDESSLPKPVVRRDVDDTNAANILTYDKLLVGILSKLKEIYWPWKLLNGRIEGSEFLKAADAASRGKPMSAGTPAQSLFPAPTNIMGSEVASARAANHRLQRGIWTSTSFGDMRRALSASERLVILGKDWKEWRDYGILLYHCGLYGPSFTYLNSYKEHWELVRNEDEFTQTTVDDAEANALENVLFRLRLILAEEEKCDHHEPGNPFQSPLSDPW